MIGKRLKQLRLSKNLTLCQLAKQTDISASFISHVENNKTSPSIASLRKILGGLGTTLGDFFIDEKSSDVSIVKRKEQMLPVTDGRNGVKIFTVTDSVKEGNNRLFYEEYSPGGDTGSKMLIHDGEEMGICLKGSIELIVDGKKYLLKEGDSFSFDSKKPHRFRNPGQTKTVVISVNTKLSF